MIYKKDATGLLQRLLGLSDGPWRWSACVQASVATAVPLAAFKLTGHQSLFPWLESRYRKSLVDRGFCDNMVYVTTRDAQGGRSII